MTEAEWLTADKSTVMTMHLHLHARETGSLLPRSRTVAVACCRAIPADVMPTNGSELLDAVERWIEKAGRRPREVGRLWFEMIDQLQQRHTELGDRRGPPLDRRVSALSAVMAAGLAVGASKHHGVVLSACEYAAHAHPDPRPAQAEAANRLRCVFGNPFRPTAFDPTWRTPTVVAIAAGAYADRAFDRLPILADALEDAGCDAAELLAHLRGPGPHARGCWALDAVLGKT